jgi:hypothetical protein
MQAGAVQFDGKAYWFAWDSDEEVLRNARWNWFTARNYCRYDSPTFAVSPPLWYTAKNYSRAHFVNLSKSPGIDSQPGALVRQSYLSYRSAMKHRLEESIPLNRFLGSINVFK